MSRSVLTLLLIAGSLLVVGCGGSDEPAASSDDAAKGASMEKADDAMEKSGDAMEKPDDAMEKPDDAMEKPDDAMEKKPDDAMEKKPDDAMEKPDAMEKKPADVMEKQPDDVMEKPATQTKTRPGALSDTQARVELTARDSKFGTVLWDGYGQVVYAFEADGPGVSNCYGDCADFWPPVLTTSAPRALAGVDAAKLGTTVRKDGAKQVTYNGWPLYYMDEPAGEIQCHNHELHGGLWWVVAPSGDPVKTGKS